MILKFSQSTRYPSWNGASETFAWKMGDIQVDRAAVVVMWNGKYNMDECCSRDLNWYDCIPSDVPFFMQQAGYEMKVNSTGFIQPGAAGKAYKYAGRKVTSVDCGAEKWVHGNTFDALSAKQDCKVTFQGLTKIK